MTLTKPSSSGCSTVRITASGGGAIGWTRRRYADSNGYTIDAERVMWPYRDWVIRAFNADMPFDQFTIEQLAGDLLPDATRDQRIASGFHRNTLINQEGGVDPEQFRVETVMDRLSTTGAVWLGLTVGCAQCHSHKYDPVSHQEYYRLFAFFNNCADMNNVGPTVEVHEGELFIPEESAADRAELNDAISSVERLNTESDTRRTAWEKSLADRVGGDETSKAAQWHVLSITAAKAEAAKLTTLDDQSVLATAGIPRDLCHRHGTARRGREDWLVSVAFHSSRFAAEVGSGAGKQWQSSVDRRGGVSRR